MRQEAAVVHGTLLAAAISPDNTPHGYNLTFAFPMLMFIIIAGVLYLRFRGSHRVPGHVALTSARWAGATTATAPASAPEQEAEEAGHGAQGVSGEEEPAATPDSTTSGSTLHEGSDPGEAPQQTTGQETTGPQTTGPHTAGPQTTEDDE
jgi:hypothetical protein